MMRFSCVLPLVVCVLVGSFSIASWSEAFELTEVAHIPLRSPTWTMTWSRDGARLSAIVGNEVVTWNAASWTEEQRFPVLRRYHAGLSLAYAGGGLLVGAPEHIAPYNGPADAYVPGSALVLWDPTSGSPLRRFPSPEQQSPDGPTRVQDVFAVSDDGTRIAAAGSVPFDPVVFIYDTASGLILHAMPAPPVPRPPPQFDPVPQPNPKIHELLSAVAFSPVGHVVAGCGFSGRVYVIDADTGTIVRTFAAYGEGVMCTAIAFNADGRMLATGRLARQYVRLGHQPKPGDRMSLEPDTGNVRVWDVPSGGMIASLPNAVGATRTLCWSRSGNRLVAGDDGTLHEWAFDDATVSEVASIMVPGGVFGAAFSPDGRLAILKSVWSIAVYR